MDTMKELQEVVKKKGSGSARFTNINGDAVYLSRGVRELFLGSEEETQKIIAAVTAFQNGNYGNAESFGKSSRPGHEYGRYEITALTAEEGEDSAVWIHRAEEAVMVYFRFER